MVDKYPTSKDVWESNTLVLGESRPMHLLDQLCYRLINLLNSIKRNKRQHANDTYNADELDKILNYFLKLSKEAVSEQEKLDRLLEVHVKINLNILMDNELLKHIKHLQKILINYQL